MASVFSLPEPLQRFLSKFPLHSYPPIPVISGRPLQNPTLWIAPPRTTTVDQTTDSNILSADVECLKWQAYLALRKATNIAIRWDISPEGGIDGRLPCLHTPTFWDNKNELLAPRHIPGWVDGLFGGGNDPLNGYKDETLKDESHAWVSLLEGVVHAALTLSEHPQPLFSQLFRTATAGGRALAATLSPPPAPLTGLSSILPSYGTNISLSSIQGQYAEAIASLSERLGTDTWFLGSENPTALDALAFAYLHCLLYSTDSTRIEVTRRVNLVAWEQRVRTQVETAFTVA
ncbi:hypothetical protein DEU56DRAFT_21666 [Suillus clintonianus]|uniref:uncharacterized protein n=1 Tax=Suillus clintonianus TaxID=1904413 RepID=UPI001B867000|nr:uncharacterized protein DEU56DRAFT_21666 [Suillus clintonianus]KAG2157462.1 hypothetical protein DEU56DRAFT_21666 [Suillus clintonianus]